jgi:choline-sulfatase
LWRPVPGPKCVVLILGLNLGLLPCLGPNQVLGEPFRPNIVLITVDTFRPDHIGYYGYPMETSPHLDAISQEGVFFKQAFSSSGWTSPGLISILTSLYAPTHGVDIRARRLDPDVETLPDVLRRAGYRAPDIFFLTDLPNFSNLGLEAYAKRAQYIYQGDEIIFKWLEEEARKDSPFFLYYHYRDLHLPYNPGEKYESMFVPQAFDAGFGLVSAVKKFLAKEKMEVVKRNVMLVRGVMDFGPGDKPWVDALYDSQIRRLDEEFFRRLRHTLAKEGLGQNTLLIISADHGEELLDHGLIGHVSTFKEGRLYDEIIRIPLIFWLPGVMPTGLVIDEPVQCIDIMPTVLDLLDMPLTEGAQGRSLLPLIQGTQEWQSKPVYLETSGAGYTADSVQYEQRFRALRTERWKMVYASPDDAYRLYDLAADPGESTDVQEQYPQLADSLRTLLNQWVLYTQKRSYKQTESALDTTKKIVEESGVPQILLPQDGDTLYYRGADYSIRPSWTGAANAAYVIEYEVGRGAYHLEGELTESNSSPNYGPFQANFWNSLMLYNPWKFRVYRKDQPEKKSEWVTFHLASTEGPPASPSFAGLVLQAGYSLRVAGRQSVYLIQGLGHGLLDLYLWAAAVPGADLSAYILLLVVVGAVLWPLVQRFGISRCRAWLAAILYVGFVYSTISLMPKVWKILSAYTQGTIRYIGILAVVLVGVAILWQTWRRVGKRTWKPYVVLGCIGLVYGYLLKEYTVFPSERLHLVEYGFVGYFFFKALSIDFSNRHAYIASFVLTVLVGVGDECIQWVLPQRFFELKDVQLNAISGGLGLLLLRFVLDSGEDKKTN